ncbi:hypothetical protein ABE10_02015, partial [Bacillus toyonensis]|nr:hypothetical protein [Bacillus toyonensis]
GHEGDDDCRGAPPVDPRAGVGPHLRQVQEDDHHAEGDETDGDVDEEHPAPAVDPQDLGGAGEQAADERADHRRDAEDGEEVSLVLGALARSQDVSHDGKGKGHQRAGTDTLEGAEAGEHQHRGREGRQERAEDEHADAEDEQRTPPEDVGQLAVDRDRDGRCDQVGGRDPGLLVQAVQVVADRADRGADDGLVERGEEHAGHEAVDDEEDLPVRHDRRGSSCDRCGRRSSGGAGHSGPSSGRGGMRQRERPSPWGARAPSLAATVLQLCKITSKAMLRDCTF